MTDDLDKIPENRFEGAPASIKILIGLATAVLLLGMLEGAVRLVYWATGRDHGAMATTQVYVPYVGYMRQPSTKYEGGRGTDRHGFLHNDDDADRDLTVKKPAVFRVFMLGGSTVAGMSASSARYTLPGLLETALKRAFKAEGIPLKPQVINTGTDGYYSNQEFLLLKYYLLPSLAPDYAVVFDGTNDFMVWGDGNNSATTLLHNNFHDYQYEFFDAYNNIFSLGGSIALVVRNLGTFSAVCDLMHRLVTRSDRFGRVIKGLVSSGNDDAAIDAFLKRHLERYETNIQSTLALSRHRKLPLSYILQPTLLRDGHHSHAEKAIIARNEVRWHNMDYFGPKAHFLNGAQTIFDSLSKAIMDDHINIRDFSDTFKNKSPATTVFRDRVHYTDHGRRQLARRFEAEIVPHVVAAARRSLTVRENSTGID